MKKTLKSGGNVLLPTFALGRAQVQFYCSSYLLFRSWCWCLKTNGNETKSFNTNILFSTTLIFQRKQISSSEYLNNSPKNQLVLLEYDEWCHSEESLERRSFQLPIHHQPWGGWGMLLIRRITSSRMIVQVREDLKWSSVHLPCVTLANQENS